MDKSREIELFGQEIFNYFENDYLMIKDFLSKETPWNDIFSLKLKIDSNEIFQLKTDLLSKMIFSYLYDIVYPLQTSSKDDDSFCIPDRIINDEVIKLKKELINERMYSEDNFIYAYSEFINTNNFAFIQIIKHYIECLKNKGYTITSNNYNAFRYDIKNIYDLYKQIQIDTGVVYINCDLKDNKTKETFSIFYHKLCIEVKKYISNTFRTDKEKTTFIKYLISLVYAYFKYSNMNSDLLNDEDKMIIEFIENDSEAYDIIYRNKEIFSLIIETIYDLYYDYGEYYDFRNKIDNKDVISRLDDTYLNKKNKQYKIDSVNTELYLGYVLGSFESDCLSFEEIYNYLTEDRISLYDKLYNSKLDPRFENEYKQDIIRKIVSDVYEYQCYLYTKLNNEIDNNHYLNINKINVNDFNNILEYFSDNYMSLLENYYAYQHESIYIGEKVKLHSYKTKELYKILKINKYAISRYMPILLNIVFELSSVDYMNKCITAISNDYKNYNIDDIVKMLSTMCLNIYENILIGNIEEKSMPYLKIFIESTDNIGEYLLNDKETRKKLETLFIKINNYGIAYSEEIKARKFITDEGNKKVLKKLNPFNE